MKIAEAWGGIFRKKFSIFCQRVEKVSEEFYELVEVVRGNSERELNFVDYKAFQLTEKFTKVLKVLSGGGSFTSFGKFFSSKIC